MIFVAGCDGETGDVEQSGPAAADRSSQMMELPTTEHPDTEGWNTLFGSSLENAEMESPDSWVIEDGVLTANDRSTIWTQDSYGNFVLDFEARTPDGTNSGVFFRTGDQSDILSALELQLFNPPGDDGSADERHVYGGRNGMASIYDIKGPSGGEPRPVDGWNRFTVTARDSMIYVVMNGEQVHEMNLNDWDEPGMNPDGTEHKFDRALMNQAESGPIGIQGVHSENEVSVEYRNLKIRELDS
jgi:hypothetical protein